jgi:hypothetical protein
MTRSAAPSHLGSEFNDFLFAPIGNEGNGMQLSVLSALARLNIDPWLEAAKLARLPRAIAVEQLGSLIAQLPGGLSAFSNPGTIATRLVARLPSQVRAQTPAPTTPRSFGAPISGGAVIRVVLINMIFVAFIVVGQWVATNHHGPAPVETAGQGPPGVPSAQTSSPGSGQ